MAKQPSDDLLQCPACHGQAPCFRCQYCEGVGGVTDERFHSYHDRSRERQLEAAFAAARGTLQAIMLHELRDHEDYEHIQALAEIGLREARAILER